MAKGVEDNKAFSNRTVNTRGSKPMSELKINGAFVNGEQHMENETVDVDFLKESFSQLQIGPISQKVFN